jgi:trimeric autotransporter adhesin
MPHKLILIPLLIVCFGLAPMAHAVGPDTDGNIPGANNGEGIGVLVNLTSGVWNTGTGFEALNNVTAGNQNTATGVRALFSDINGGFNTATGVYSLYSNTAGFYNSATGAYSLSRNTIGNFNTANGYSALYFNTEGENNTATGFGALYKNTTGDGNTANGYQALNRNIMGVQNTATGREALFNNTGGANTANGAGALFQNTDGAANTAIGFAALGSSHGSFNIGLGFLAGNAVSTASGVIAIGVSGANVDSRTYIGNIGTFAQAPAIGTVEFVTVELSSGRLGHNASSRRYKEDIKPMGDASEVLYKLKPVTFTFKEQDIDPKKGPQPQNLDYGLIAEDVAEIDPKLAIRDGKGQIESVRYMAIYNMMLNEFLKEHQKVEAQQATIAELKSTVAQQQKGMEVLTAQLKEQAAQIQKVSAQLETSKPAAKVVANTP